MYVFQNRREMMQWHVERKREREWVRVREGNETSSMLQKTKQNTKNKEDGRLLLTLFFHSWLSWKIDTKKRHTQDLYRFLRTHTHTHMHTPTRTHINTEKGEGNSSNCPHSELEVSLRPPWLFVWFIQRFSFRDLLRNKPLSSPLNHSAQRSLQPYQLLPH